MLAYPGAVMVLRATFIAFCQVKSGYFSFWRFRLYCYRSIINQEVNRGWQSMMVLLQRFPNYNPLTLKQSAAGQGQPIRGNCELAGRPVL